MKLFIKLLCACALLFSGNAFAQSITPATASDTIAIGDTGSTTLTVTTPSTTATDLVDIVFLADNTGSLGSIIAQIQAAAADILASLTGSGTLDVRFGVTSFFGDPTEGVAPGGPTIGDNGTAFNLITPLTNDLTAVQNGINEWRASGGGDAPEGGLFGLHQIATAGANTAGGVGTGLDVGFRDGATRIVVWFGDVNQHTETINVPDTISALQAAGIVVIAISTGSGDGLNSSFGGEAANQGLDIATATGGVDTSLTGGVDIVDAILNTVGTVTSTLDLSLAVSETFTGLPVTITCIDALGCDNVGAGESRDFSVMYEGVDAGVYTFGLSASGLSASSTLTVTVGDPMTAEVPLPAALPFMLTGLAAGGAFMRRRKKAA